ncbi:hypothetical protein jhhlp_000044 [Lomentospora prolificans]|uniref:Endonuclease/exonuclease/phosphatase domain-containing protein n=1 Tax=Lomentospora prolificans TaxID=41688 RepID=A0A2N3NLF1_9PEZI|nr:hypothetical protein jhhlp_000044 [Lomentospora prolificans]
MSFLANIRSPAISWWRATPLPAEDPEAPSQFRRWHRFDESCGQWVVVKPTNHESAGSQRSQQDRGSDLTLYTWNVDAGARWPQLRIAAIISHLLNSTPTADIIFLQELTEPAFDTLLTDQRIRQNWFLSEGDTTAWQNSGFSTVTLLSRARFGHPQDTTPERAALGPVWRVQYPSRFGRDALCCDIFLPSAASKPEEPKSQVRLINVHLDSLALNPSQRPRQIAIAASFLQSVGRGLVAGDFNPVLEEDASLVANNGLLDAWLQLHPDEPGFTWGIDGKQHFPPGRLDKVATLGLQPVSIEVIEPGVARQLSTTEVAGNLSEQNEATNDGGQLQGVSWSDHCGLRCVFRMAPE